MQGGMARAYHASRALFAAQPLEANDFASKVLQSNKPVVVDCYAEFASPTRMPRGPC